MSEIDQLFRAKSDSVLKTMAMTDIVGFSIPEYQRGYHWDTEKIKRLLEDCISRLSHLSSKHRNEDREDYTFLGTIILVTELDSRSDEPLFSIIDGQQRFTTLSLLCCALIEKIENSKPDLATLDGKTKFWMENEAKCQEEVLFKCISGTFAWPRDQRHFPRIIRLSDKDKRGTDKGDYEYRSAIAHFLHEFSSEFSKAFESGTAFDFSLSPRNDHSEDKQLFSNYRYIQRQINALYDGNRANSDDIECEFVAGESFGNSSFRKLFQAVGKHFENGGDQNRALTEISKIGPPVENFIRLILFSSYLTHYVVLTRVETDNEDYAFDIFDALNTTGEPLTALEALKPKVVQFENSKQGKRGRYDGSQAKGHLDSLDQYLRKNPKKRQDTTRNLVISFALYYDGSELARPLGLQRSHLQKYYEKYLNSAEDKEKFIESIAHVAHYQSECWDADGIENLPESDDRQDTLKLCLTFIAATGTSLTIPILARYWNKVRGSNQGESFEICVKALAAFLVLRRAATGTTSGIDDDFKNLMKETPKINEDLAPLSLVPPLPRSEVHYNQPLDPYDFKSELKKHLEESIGVTSKETWLNKACAAALPSNARAVSRLLLFAATHKSKSDRPGFLTRKGVRSNQNFLSCRAWNDPKYRTIEHVHPRKPSAHSNWDKTVTKSPTVNMVGNMILLPTKQNSRISNSEWDTKIQFYSALASEDNDEFERIINEAVADKDISMPVGKALINENKVDKTRLSMLDPIVNVENWNKDFIEERSENILSLAWDVIAKWLDFE